MKTPEEKKEIIRVKNKRNYEKNKEKAKAYYHQYQIINKDNLAEYKKDYRKNNKEKISKYKKDYRVKNKERIKTYYKVYQPIRNETNKQRCLNDNLFKINKNTRTLIANKLKAGNYTKKSRTHEILGCSYESYLKHIEIQWLLPQNLNENGCVWMSWENYGKYNGEFNYGWDIDHIIPLSSAKSEEELLKLFHFTNCQPLCSYVNRHIKRDIFINRKIL